MENPFQPIYQRLESIEALLQKIQQQKDSILSETPSQRSVFSLEQLCDHYKFSRQQIYKLTSKQGIPFSKRGKFLFFEKAAIDQWLVENRVATSKEIQGKAHEYISKNRLRRRG